MSSNASLGVELETHSPIPCLNSASPTERILAWIRTRLKYEYAMQMVVEALTAQCYIDQKSEDTIWADPTDQPEVRLCPHRTHYLCNLGISIDIFHGYEFRSTGAAMSVDNQSEYAEIEGTLRRTTSAIGRWYRNRLESAKQSERSGRID
ncbi:hypothetical protein F5J12DRAFT_298073 [Pisolithus orientalis]|uniref:uncharacterized protein n=1 Tax=Pisolithus orientalis TaxID=936130 RepID=UPI00222538DF|nr:uncharacterized protein F5J12DRAFT_298073 [Pisolithus orientalis]KAI6030559.1 hypothetical protein F5J12DRAFT_298073 [Pisolithus orientalis]